MRDFHSAQNEFPPFNQSVDIIPNPNVNHGRTINWLHDSTKPFVKELPAPVLLPSRSLRNGLRHLRSVLWKRHIKGGPLPDFALRPGTTAMALDDVFYYRQSETGPTLLARTGFIDSVKPFKHSLQRLRWNPGTVILNRDFDLSVFNRARPNSYRPFIASVLDRVVDEITQNLLQ